MKGRTTHYSLINKHQRKISWQYKTDSTRTNWQYKNSSIQYWGKCAGNSWLTSSIRTQNRWNSGPATKSDYSSIVQAHRDGVRQARAQLQSKAANDIKTRRSSAATWGLKDYKESNGLVLNRAAGLVTDIRLMVSVPLLPQPWPAKCPRPLFLEARLRKRDYQQWEKIQAEKAGSHHGEVFLYHLRDCADLGMSQTTVENQVLAPNSRKSRNNN